MTTAAAQQQLSSSTAAAKQQHSSSSSSSTAEAAAAAQQHHSSTTAANSVHHAPPRFRSALEQQSIELYHHAGIHVIETAAKVVFAAVGNRASRRVVYLFVFSVFR